MKKLFPNKMSVVVFLAGMVLIIVGIGSLVKYPEYPAGGWFAICMGGAVSGGLAIGNLRKKRGQ